MDLKSVLKALKLNESTISMLLGTIVIVAVGVLLVNYFREKGITIPGQRTEETETLEKTHTVAQGETLWAIAEKYYGSGYNWVDIAKENNLANADVIEVGQSLTIPDVEPLTPTRAVVEREDVISGATYEVVKGDTLWDIAIRAYGDGYRWVEIARENKLANPDIIHSGNIFVIPR